MKRFFALIFMLLLLVFTGDSFDVYAASYLPEPEFSIYLDGYPVEGTIIGNSSVNVYEAGSFDAAIDTVEPGTAVTIVNLQVWANGTNYFRVSYIKDDVEYSGLVEYDFVQPIGAVITPAPMVDIEEFDRFSLEAIWDILVSLKDSFLQFIDFIFSLPDIVATFLPFLSEVQVSTLVTFIYISFIVGCYFFFKKVV